MKKVLSLLLLLFAVYLMNSRCSEGESEADTEQIAWLNHADTVSYVGIETCKTCHAGVHETFIETGMGQSLGAANRVKSIALIDGDSSLYDPHRDLYYRPFWKGDSLWVEEFRIEDGVKSHSFKQQIDYVIGSGQHTNSHLFEVGDHYHQAPFTWYAQKSKLDFPPGFEGGNNSRFSRLIGLECMSCHNAMPTEFVKGSTNKFKSIPQGINCERCHGPGGAHVAKIMRGEITDTAKEADRSIVNPKRLSAQLQFEICQRCHLQGNAVLKSGKSFFDFKPGMELKEVMQVFLPRYSNSEDEFIMASHADRFKLSACYQSAPEQYTCTSCHNPHFSVQSTNTDQFNATCSNCHGQSTKVLCSESAEQRTLKDDNCVACHMPSSSSIDIPHVTVHDHFIRKPKELYEALEKNKAEFLRLEAINDAQPSYRDKALAYLQQYERFEAETFYLDSARIFIEKMDRQDSDYVHLQVYYHFLKGDYAGLKDFADNYDIEAILAQCNSSSYDNHNAWTLYRLAEAYNIPAQVSLAGQMYLGAIRLAPYIADFQNKYASLLYKEGQVSNAQSWWERALAEEPRHKESLSNLAFSYLQSGELEKAKSLLSQCTQYYPDYSLGWKNQSTLAFQIEDRALLRKSLKNILRLEPQNNTAREFYQSQFND